MTKDLENRPHFGRVFDAAASSDWLITEEAFRTILAVASRTNPANAVEAYRSEQMQNTHTVKVRDGVAVIPVTGPISRYMTWFSMISGGTSISVLGRDLQAALDDPLAYSVMFEINSPGGEVTGVHEFAQMVFKGRKKKPITARVGGLGCSAAYWIAAMCGDIAIDQTAQLGSIGVMAVYLDDRKWLEKNGLDEIEFISSQSPYKNVPPYTDEGRKRIQARLDAICQVFVESVAKGRGVSVETVLKEFGQGDVFVGAAAIQAGLADRFGSYESTIALLAKAHTPGYFATAVDDDPEDEIVPDNDDDDFDDKDPYAAQKTITHPAAVNFQPVDRAGEPAANDSNKNEDSMKDEKANDVTADATENTDKVETEQPKAEQPPAKETAADLKQESSGDELAAMRERLAASEKANLESAAKIKALEQEALDKWIGDSTANLAGEVEANKTILGSLVAAHGKDSAEVKTFLENQAALTEQLTAGGLFKEIGKGGSDTDNSAERQLDAKAKELMAKDPKLTKQQALTEAYEQNPDLYQAMQDGN